MKTKLLFFGILFGFGIFSISAQNDTLVQREAKIGYDINGNAVSLKPETPPLTQVAGAPKAYYSIFWELGDGTYSKEKEPTHVYKKQGNYTVRMWATNHYDNGKAPATRPQQISIKQDEDSALDEASMTNDLELIKNREPIPNEDLMVVMSYKNTKDYVTNGKLYFFYNEYQYKADNFQLEDIRTYHGEQRTTAMDFASVSTENQPELYYASNSELLEKLIQQDSTERKNLPETLSEAQKKYREYEYLEFDNMMPNEERNIFIQLRTTPEMLKDTSAIISVRSVYVPDAELSNHKVKDLEMEIVTSHDPNKMSSNAAIMNYRLVRLKTFKFKTRFQNDGEGPANTIRLETEIPKMFDPQTIKVVDQYPECPICPDEREVTYSCLDTVFKKDLAIFTYKNIYLPGTQQKNVREKDSTKGFVKYTIKLKDDFHKKKTRTRTSIYFDKNEPIVTNYATTRFLPGLSIGAKAGYLFNIDDSDTKEYMIGATISPYKTYRGYFQAEVMLSAKSFESFREFTEEETVNEVFVNRYTNQETLKENAISAYLVPASYRYNLNNFLAVGAGVIAKVDLYYNSERQTNGEYELVIPSEGEVIRDESQDRFSMTEKSCGFINFQTGVFAGFNVGGARIGPSVGARYVYYFNEPHQQLQVYGIWKF